MSRLHSFSEVKKGKFCILTTNESEIRPSMDRSFASVAPNTFDSNIDEWDAKWAEGETVTWKLEKPSNDFNDQYNVHRIFALCFMAWKMHIKDIKFRSIRRSTADADIPINFVPKNDDALFKERNGVLAYAWFPGKSLQGGDMVYNDDYIWTADGKSVNAHEADPTNYPDPNTRVRIRTYNLQHTGTHELGHALGLRHAENCPQCVMHPYYNEQVQPQENDVERIQGFYGQRNLPAFWLNYLTFRIRRGWIARH